MTEYWKSNPRKFCDFCKCWISDNKPSIEFHERGKRHQQNVQIKIAEVRKSSEKKAKEKAELEDDLQTMEKAALEAFRKDLQNNPALAEHYRAKAKAARDAQALIDEKKSSKSKKKEEAQENSEEIKKGIWYEAVSSEGYPYYWNSITNEPVWVAPEHYISLAEQEKGEIEEEVNVPIDANNIPLPEEEEPPSPDTDEVEPDIPLPTRDDPRTARSMYGGWETVSVTQLPPPEDIPVEEIPLPEPITAEKPTKQKFREKTVTALYSKPGEIVTFKKRKIASGARNARQRNSEDS